MARYICRNYDLPDIAEGENIGGTTITTTPAAAAIFAQRLARRFGADTGEAHPLSEPIAGVHPYAVVMFIRGEDGAYERDRTEFLEVYRED